MHYNNFFDFGNGFQFGAGGLALIGVLGIWELVWKGLGLWKAAKNNQNIWFVAILLINSLGILPILYIYVFAPKQNGK